MAACWSNSYGQHNTKTRAGIYITVIWYALYISSLISGSYYIGLLWYTIYVWRYVITAYGLIHGDCLYILLC